jgi:hypothetical protein
MFHGQIRVLVSKTWIIIGSSDFWDVKDSPPRTNTRDPAVAIECPERPLGAGPMFWNMNQRLSESKISFIIAGDGTRTCDFKGGEVIEVLAIHSATTENVHDIVHESSGMSFAGDGYKAYTCEFLPYSSVDVKRPSVIVMI